MRLLKKIRNILVGNWRRLRHYQTDETERRRQICKKCDSNIKFMGARVCSQCGCIIKAKTAVESEKCLLNKW